MSSPALFPGWTNPNLSNSYLSLWLGTIGGSHARATSYSLVCYSCLFPTSSTKQLKCWVALDSPLLSLGNSQSFQLREKVCFPFTSFFRFLLKDLLVEWVVTVAKYIQQLYIPGHGYWLTIGLSFQFLTNEKKILFSPCFITTKVELMLQYMFIL